MTILHQISREQIRNMRKQIAFFWNNYFSSMSGIALTTLQIINDRVFPYASRNYEEWNDPPILVSKQWRSQNRHSSVLLCTFCTWLNESFSCNVWHDIILFNMRRKQLNYTAFSIDYKDVEREMQEVCYLYNSYQIFNNSPISITVVFVVTKLPHLLFWKL